MGHLNPTQRILRLAILPLVLLSLPAIAETKKVGVLLVSHGSRSDAWRQSLMDLEGRVRAPILASGQVDDIKTAFMEYTEPSIATRLKEFDAAGFTDVVIVPVFLTVSPHTWDDIPTIIGLKEDPSSLQQLKIEKIERYTPKARARLSPPLDFPGILGDNLLRRAKALSRNAKDEGLVLIAYGDHTYEKQWSDLLTKMGQYVEKEAGISAMSYGWCGHIAHYDPAKTTEAIEKVLTTKKTALVVPVLVAYDEMFQVKIIGDGIAKVADHEKRVLYKPDSILPDGGVDKWVREVSISTAKEMRGEAVKASL